MAAKETRDQRPTIAQHDTDKEIASPAFPVVGIGSSAGGLQALEQLLAHLRPDTGMSFIVASHLDPTHKSLLSELLAKSTSMPVKDALDGINLLPNHVYVLPSNASLTVGQGALHLVARSTQRADMHLPINDLFHSLATNYEHYALGVVLSGSGSDGAAGVSAIMLAGGITFAQDERSAQFFGMPSAAIAAGVDYVLSPVQIAAQLGELAQSFQGQNGRHSHESRDGLPAWEQSLEKIQTLLRTSRGVDFSAYKRPTVRRRIMRRMALQKIDSAAVYFNYLKDHPSELESLFEDILVKVTSFFRDPETFQILRDQVLVQAIKSRETTDPFRVWVPGCATGEEVYSIAMIVFEVAEELGVPLQLEIFATDVSEVALARARAGRYHESIQQQVSSERLQKFFHRDGESFCVIPTIRESCIFARQDVTRDPPFSKLDLISCRNLLIYLAPQIQRRVLTAFHFALNPAGFLTLGSAETLGSASDLFQVIDKTARIYAKRPAIQGVQIPNFQWNRNEIASLSRVSTDSIKQKSERPIDTRTDADRAILRFMPPSVVVNERLEITQFRGDTSPFLLQPSGEPTRDLLKMCRSGLLFELRAAIAEAEAISKPIWRDVELLDTQENSFNVHLNVIPFDASPAGLRHFVIMFDRQQDRIVATKALRGDAGSEVNRLQEELSSTKDFLHAIIEKEQATNEELKSVGEEILSANEELQSTNEELATAKEEIQAANEELITVNEELRQRNDDLSVVNSDLANLFGSVQIPIVMLSANLAVRRFTPTAEKVLNLSASDLGKSLSDFGERLGIEGLERLALEVMESLNTREEDIQDRNGRWYSLRIKPYRTSDNRIDGTVIALVDIDSLKRSYERLEEALQYADAIIQATPVPLLVVDLNHKVITTNHAFYSYFKTTPASTIGHSLIDLVDGKLAHPGLLDRLEKVSYRDKPTDSITVDQVLPGLGRRIVQVSARSATSGPDARKQTLLAFLDVTSQTLSEEGAVAAQNAAEAASRAKSEFLANMSHEIRTPLGAVLGYAELLGKPDCSESDRRSFLDRIRHNGSEVLELIDDILDLAKVEAGRLTIDKTRFDLMEELSDILIPHQAEAQIKGLELQVIFAGPIPSSIFSCRRRFRQIINNIVNNAIKFTSKGRVDVRVELDSAGKQPQLRISVTDMGCGLTPEQQLRLFQPFGQADSTITRRFGGTGLGLVLSRHLASLLGGDVVLTRSEPDQGTTFTITIDPGPMADIAMRSGSILPEHKSQAQDKPSDWFRESRRLSGIRVLLVEDGIDNQLLLSRFLDMSGAQVQVAANGDDALVALNGATYDVVLMDLQMPVMDGYQAMKRIRQRGMQVPVLALTAHAMAGERERCMDHGFNDYMSKPVQPNLLIDVVSKLVKAKQHP